MNELPPPVLDLTTEQEFTLAKVKEMLKDAPHEELVNYLLSEVRYKYILQNNLTNLIKGYNNNDNQTGSN